MDEKTDSLFSATGLLIIARGVFATLVLMPISVLYDGYVAVRNAVAAYRKTAPALHQARVTRVIRQIEDWQRDGCREKLCTARSGWKTMSELLPKYKLSHRKIDLRMHDILSVDEHRRIVRVEPLATMGQISKRLIGQGWILPVVPELEDLTVGGLVMGFGIETSSHKYGLFHSICESFEIVSAEGRLIRCSKTENAELYHLIPWSHGTLGFLVAAELKIIPARKYVRIEYQPTFSLDETVGLFEAACRNTAGNDFVEAIVYSRDTAVVMRGSLIDDAAADGPVNDIGRWHKPWFYTHARSFLRERRKAVEYIPLRAYLHRHTRSYFWMMEEIIPFGNHPLFRALLGWAVPPKVELLKRTETRVIRRLRDQFQVLQDILMPVSFLATSIDYLEGSYGLYPLWLSPMAVYENERHMGFVHPHRNPDGTLDELFVDIGVYGSARKPNLDNARELTRLEQFVIDHHGYQALYAKTTMSRDDFRRMFDHSDYERLRQKMPYCLQAFDEVYDKVSAAGRASPSELRRLERMPPMMAPADP